MPKKWMYYRFLKFILHYISVFIFFIKVFGTGFHNFAKKEKFASFVVGDLYVHYNSYYQTLRTKAHEGSADRTGRAAVQHRPSVLAATPHHGVILARTLLATDKAAHLTTWHLE